MIKSREKELHEALSKYTDGIDVGVDVQKLGTLNTLVSNMLEDCLVVPRGDGSLDDEPPAKKKKSREKSPPDENAPGTSGTKS